MPALAAMLALAGCARPAMAPETFDWAGGPIRIEAPPAAWRREGWNQGGWVGVAFVRERSLGERIMVAEHYTIAGRDVRPALRGLLRRFDARDARELEVELQRARPRRDDPLSAGEAVAAAAIDAALERARGALVAGEREVARREVAAALGKAEAFRITLPELIERVEFRPERHEEPARWTLTRRSEGRVAGEPAVVTEFRFRSPERTFTGREVTFVHDNRLFIASYFGSGRNLPQFERLLASVAFPRSGVSP